MDAFRNRVAIVTGASSGIGEATSLALAAQGAHLVLAARSEDKLLEVARRAQDLGAPTALVVPTDVRDPEACRKLVERTVEALGRVDLLINNAGAGDWSLLAYADPKRIEKLVRTNVLGLIYMSRFVASVMLQQKAGTITQIASLAGLMGLPFQAVYGATKAAVIAFTRSLRAELESYGVRVVLVLPGPVRTPFFTKANMGHFERLRLPVVEPEQAARRIIAGSARGQRLVFMDSFGRLVYYSSLLMPGLVDRMAKQLYFRAQRWAQNQKSPA
ncbi:MAG: SDR family NAD(P)-dependent oxidoreductase [Bacteroidota bacterium]|nr:SDR family NAD(P)-dependent oxidoreductase [Rhodothermia bacterium]MDW8285067.1 SDR family NAD(P)-dependent oxidoreductase [Bacteroidota bacterium]